MHGINVQSESIIGTTLLIICVLEQCKTAHPQPVEQSFTVGAAGPSLLLIDD